MIRLGYRVIDAKGRTMKDPHMPLTPAEYETAELAHMVAQHWRQELPGEGVYVVPVIRLDFELSKDSVIAAESDPWAEWFANTGHNRLQVEVIYGQFDALRINGVMYHRATSNNPEYIDQFPFAE